ncbi:MAG: hypothetical protein AVDCRST_MAG27-2979, partial [uncultured Craurococcus sp.]
AISPRVLPDAAWHGGRLRLAGREPAAAAGDVALRLPHRTGGPAARHRFQRPAPHRRFPRGRHGGDRAAADRHGACGGAHHRRDRTLRREGDARQEPVPRPFGRGAGDHLPPRLRARHGREGRAVPVPAGYDGAHGGRGGRRVQLPRHPGLCLRHAHRARWQGDGVPREAGQRRAAGRHHHRLRAAVL